MHALPLSYIQFVPICVNDEGNDRRKVVDFSDNAIPRPNYQQCPLEFIAAYSLVSIPQDCGTGSSPDRVVHAPLPATLC